jgi:hypothetical protein
MKYLKRIIGLPFFLMLNIIGMAFMLFKLAKSFILYGGEATAYVKKHEQKTITDIYQQLQNNYNQHKELDLVANHTNVPNKESYSVPFHTICTSCKNGGTCGCTLANNMVNKPY